MILLQIALQLLGIFRAIVKNMMRIGGEVMQNISQVLVALNSSTHYLKAHSYMDYVHHKFR
jgi:hypothetical protein